jgi:hypothetical protein
MVTIIGALSGKDLHVIVRNVSILTIFKGILGELYFYPSARLEYTRLAERDGACSPVVATSSVRETLRHGQSPSPLELAAPALLNRMTARTESSHR